MFEFDSDEDELILDDYENEVISSFLYEAVETGVTQPNQASMSSLSNTIAWACSQKRNFHLSSAFFGKNTIFYFATVQR